MPPGAAPGVPFRPASRGFIRFAVGAVGCWLVPLRWVNISLRSHCDGAGGWISGSIQLRIHGAYIVPARIR